VSIPAEYTAQLRGYDLNVVTQTIDLPAGQGFDLVIATNVLVYYDRLQQALAMANIARMMNSGAVFLANNVLPAQHTTSLEYLGRKSVTYSRTGVYGDDVVVYRRR
jgi:chemotaxis methyl-accepting protein methylase